MENFLGKWEVTGTENMEEMLKAFDMEDAKRQIYADMKFTMEYRKEADDKWEYTVTMPHSVKKTFHFRIGQEFESTTLDGRPILSCIDFKDGKFVEIHRDKADPTLDAQMTREVVGDELIVLSPATRWAMKQGEGGKPLKPPDYQGYLILAAFNPGNSARTCEILDGEALTRKLFLGNMGK